MPTAPALDRRTRASAVLLQALLSTQAILAACPLACLALDGLGVDPRWAPTTLAANAAFAIWLSLPEGFLWAWWVSEVHSDLREIGACGDDLAPGWLWPAALLPVASCLARLGVVGRLARASDPSRLPPVVEAREQAGGFRDDPIVRGPLAPWPRVDPWWHLWRLGSLPTLLVLVVSTGSPSPLGPLFLVSALAGRMLVSGVTANLAELTRRHRRHAARAS